MSKLLKLLERIRNNPKTVKFEEIDKILLHAGYIRTQPRGGSSHYTYKMVGKENITIPRKIPYINEVYVKIALDAVDI